MQQVFTIKWQARHATFSSMASEFRLKLSWNPRFIIQTATIETVPIKTVHAMAKNRADRNHCLTNLNATYNVWMDSSNRNWIIDLMLV